jgi:hypothetical protein
MDYLLVSSLLALGLTFAGIWTNMRIWNLASIPFWIMLGITWDAPAVYVGVVGLILWQFYYAFVANVK